MIYLVCGADPDKHNPYHMDFIQMGGDVRTLGDVIDQICGALLDPDTDIYIVGTCGDGTPTDRQLGNALQRQRILLGSRHKLKPDGSIDRKYKATSHVDVLLKDLERDWAADLERDARTAQEGQSEDVQPPDVDAPEPPPDTDPDGESPKG